MDNKEALELNKWMWERWDAALEEQWMLKEMKFYERWMYRLGWFCMRRCARYIKDIKITYHDPYVINEKVEVNG